MRNALAKNIRRICSGSRAGCNGISLQATRLPLQSQPLQLEHALEKSGCVPFRAPTGNSRVLSREFPQITDTWYGTQSRLSQEFPPWVRQATQVSVTVLGNPVQLELS